MDGNFGMIPVLHGLAALIYLLPPLILGLQVPSAAKNKFSKEDVRWGIRYALVPAVGSVVIALLVLFGFFACVSQDLFDFVGGGSTFWKMDFVLVLASLPISVVDAVLVAVLFRRGCRQNRDAKSGNR